MTDPRHDDRVCGVCGRPAIGIGFIPYGSKDLSKVIWCCDDLHCVRIASETYYLKQHEFGRLDTMAALDGGNEGGAFLDSIGKTDLASLTEVEWEKFLRTVIGGYRAALKGRLRDEAPF